MCKLTECKLTECKLTECKLTECKLTEYLSKSIVKVMKLTRIINQIYEQR